MRLSEKRFLYMVESFLLTEGEAWSAELQKAQDVLGEGHDLDVLHELVSKLARKKSLPKTAARQSLRRIEAAARKRKAEYLALISQRSHRNGSASANSPERENEATLRHHRLASPGPRASGTARGAP